MIVETRQSELSDVASIRTLVVVDELQKTPRHLVKLLYASLFMSLLCFIFMLVDNISISPLKTVPTILAFVLLLPHHSASLLLIWLHRHQSESTMIKLPFTPYSSRVIAYAVFLTIMWGASTGMCSADLYFSSRMWTYICTYPDPSDLYQPPHCRSQRVTLPDYWTSFASTLTSSLELVLIVTITIICCIHTRRKTVPVEAPPSTSEGSLPESKVISA
ncbi:hypothetical protein CVT25_007543 [Psilocybe cyanescens]|uniref:MARVEL domain-containing protein n=1 Tax=Psilocybe cyanescens TaxID=93625 RepID=A0A409X230_PSICY|nr:hypothetical protein CVT25_007543 [Psilocybe cyanescens]